MIAFVFMGSGLLVVVFLLSWEQEEQLLDRDDALECGDAGLDVSGGAVLVYELDDAVVVIDSEDPDEESAGLVSGKVNLEVPPADWGLMRVGESLERKSR